MRAHRRRRRRRRDATRRDAIGFRDKNSSSDASASPTSAAARPHGTSDKLDLLFVVDNSATMGIKQKLLRQSVPALVDRLIRPRCLDGAGAQIGQTDLSGTCTAGQPGFVPVRDIDVGIVTSSLGGYGSDQCVPDQGGHVDDRGHLVNRVGSDGRPSSEAAPSGFLAWLPDVPENAAKPRDPAVVGATPSNATSKGSRATTSLRAIESSLSTAQFAGTRSLPRRFRAAAATIFAS